MRILVDGLWPRGLKRDTVAIDEWLKDIAPTATLRKWFAHEVEKWPEFRKRYRRELAGGPQKSALQKLRGLQRQGKVTLVFAARDSQHNNAVVLKELLEKE